MGVYSYYYLGKWGDDRKLHHLAPFRKDGRPCDIFSYKSSWFDDTKIPMWALSFEQLGDDIIKEFSDDDIDYTPKQWCYLNEIPCSEIIKKGYVLKNEIELFENGDIDDFGIVLDDHEYVKMLEDKARGINTTKKYYSGVEDDEVEVTVNDFEYHMWLNNIQGENAGYYIHKAAKIFAKGEDEKDIVVYRATY